VNPDNYPKFELLVWEPQNPNSTNKILDWLQTQPRKDIIGYIQIGQQRQHQITGRNRHTWEKILGDLQAHSQQLVENEE